jgi:hypothetical protein
MPLWSEINPALIEVRPSGNTRTKAVYKDGPLRFQIPRGYCRYGVSQYKSITLANLDPKFISWFSELENKLRHPDGNPLKSCLTEYGLRIKMDDCTLVFNSDSKFVADEHVEGYLRDLDMSCIVDVEGAYLWRGSWGINCRAHQIKFYAPVPKIPDIQMEEDQGSPPFKGCAFLDSPPAGGAAASAEGNNTP